MRRGRRAGSARAHLLGRAIASGRRSFRLLCRVLCAVPALFTPMTAIADYLAVAPIPLYLPAFHRPHFGYQTEWWYYTGFLSESGSGRTYGVQFTLFKSELAPGVKSAADIRILSLQHFAVTDITRGSFHGKTDAVRNVPGLSRWRSFADGLEFRAQGATLTTIYALRGNRHSISIGDAGMHLSAHLQTAGKPVLQGRQGFSTKTHAGTASWYVSLPDVVGPAELRLGGRNVKGILTAWMDHEVSSRFVGDATEGWDWIHFSMPDGRRVSGFRVRGKRDFFYAREIFAGLTTDPDLTWEVLKTASSASGTRYPIAWKLRGGQHEWIIRALVDDCEMQGYVPYWEGPVSVMDKNGRAGRGYLEMTGYGKKLPPKL